MLFKRHHVAFALTFCLYLFVHSTEGLYYDGVDSFSIYPRLDLHLCGNSSLSFDFTISTTSPAAGSSATSASALNKIYQQSLGRLLVYAEQQIEISSPNNPTSKKLINSYFLIKLVGGNRLVINDFWSLNEISIPLPADYMTSWFKFVYSRQMRTAEISLFKYESATVGLEKSAASIKLMPLFTKQIVYSNYVLNDLSNLFPSTDIEDNQIDLDDTLSNNAAVQAAYSNLLVGGIGENYHQDVVFSLSQLANLEKFHGYLMNLQYTSLSSQCSVEICSKLSTSQRQYAIFSSSSSKQYKLDHQFLDRDLLMIDDICESNTLTHDLCPRDCSCLSNNFVTPYFSCECPEFMKQVNQTSKAKCSMLHKSFVINLDDLNYFNRPSLDLKSQHKFDYPIMPSFTKTTVESVDTSFDKIKGVQFKDASARLILSPSAEVASTDSCFWNADDCAQGFIQHMIISIDRLDEKKASQKVILFSNGAQQDTVKFVCYLHKNRIHFSLYEEAQDSNSAVEWLASSFPLDKVKDLNRNLKLTITWLREKYLSLHIDGFLVDIVTKPSSPPVNNDIYASLNSPTNRHLYEYGMRSAGLTSDKIINHQFSIKYIRRDYYNDVDVHDSRIIVSSPLPSEIIRIDNTQRVMYKIDSPLTGVTTESIELSFRTAQSDGVIFYIRNTPIVTYFELVRGQPVVTIDTGYKNIYLRPAVPAALNDNKWHEVKLHRDGETISINIDSQYYDSNELSSSTTTILTGGYVYLGLADPNNINLSEKKTFVGEMVRGKVTINNIQQKVVQQPYYWPQTPAFVTNQTVSIDASQLTTSPDGKMINIVINVYGPPGFTAGVNGLSTAQKTEADTHFIYLDNLPDTRYISVSPSDREIDFRVPGNNQGKAIDSFLIKFQTRQHCGQLVTLVNDRRNYIGLELNDGFLYSSSSLGGARQRYQISRVRVDDGRIYQVNLKQEGQKLLCWLDVDDSYRQSILYSSPIVINTIRVAGQDGQSYGFVSPNPFVGCIGSILFNERDIIDYKYVPSERRQSCQNVVQLPVPVASTTAAPAPAHQTAPVSLGYISFQRPADVLAYTFVYDHEKPFFEDISFIFRTTTPNGVLFSAHNNDNGQNPHLIGAYLRDGLVHVVYLNSSFTQELHFANNPVDDGSLYRLNIRRNMNGHGFIQLQSYVGVTAQDFYTQPGAIQFSKINVGGADQWSRIRFFGTRPDFNGCIIDLFQVNGNSVIKPADIPKERYNCNVEGPKQRPTSRPPVQPSRRPTCLPEGYPVSFDSSSDALTAQLSEAKVCENLHIPFRTTLGKCRIFMIHLCLKK
jgi:hypothetical protein